ncbi:MAG: cytidyltransferase-like protein, FAD synthetase [Candidatus Peregrinibacteria bacterium GW2011_GWF2_43_17]|nr:MAG: cytidyltransferase-like protein, FAD synthetase [Candidatus Peregrinibacteria bacterium GW2011_GWF2_43_17]HAU40373.1 FAD synthase [Candidatus Peregrinibacteria bacterium]
MAFGTFDYFHAGHESYLKQAKALGDNLTVVIARDETVKHIKGHNPDISEKKRLKTIKTLPFVDKVILGNKSDKFKIIRSYKPDIIALGYDQFVFTYQLKTLLIKYKMNTKIVRLEPFQPDINKSSIIKNKKICASLEEVESSPL